MPRCDIATLHAGVQVQDSSKIAQIPLDFSRAQSVSAVRTETQ